MIGGYPTPMFNTSRLRLLYGKESRTKECATKKDDGKDFFTEMEKRGV